MSNIYVKDISDNEQEVNSIFETKQNNEYDINTDDEKSDVPLINIKKNKSKSIVKKQLDSEIHNEENDNEHEKKTKLAKIKPTVSKVKRKRSCSSDTVDDTESISSDMIAVKKPPIKRRKIVKQTVLKPVKPKVTKRKIKQNDLSTKPFDTYICFPVFLKKSL